MYKMMILLLLLTVAGSSLAGERFDYCAKTNEIRITELYPPIRIVGDPEKKGVIKVRLPIKCKTRKVVIPSSLDEALELLDSSLPLDFKVAITKGEYINPYFYGHYGASVEKDLDLFYSGQWKLVKEMPVCEAVWEKYEDYGDCFGILLNLLRDRYVSNTEERP